MPSIFDHSIAYVEDLASFGAAKRASSRMAGVKGLAIKLHDSAGNPLCDRNAEALRGGEAKKLRTAGFSLGAWSCPRYTPAGSAAATSALYVELGLSFCVFETEWEYKSDGGKVDVADLLLAWRRLRPKAYTGFATEGGPPTTFNHAAIIADPFAFLCPENYWLQNVGYDVRSCLQRCESLGYEPGRVKPTLTGVEGHEMSEALIRAYRGAVWAGSGKGFEPGCLLWRGDMLSSEDYRLTSLAAGDLFLA